jgi:hypothetical protein
MCEPQGLSVLGILSDVGSTVAGSWKPLAATVAAVAVCGFVAAYAVYLAVAAFVFVAVVVGFAVWTTRYRRYETAPAASVVTVTTRQGQGVRAITAGQRAIGAPRVVLPGQVLEAVPGERVER